LFLSLKGEHIMMHHSPAMKVVGMITWLVTALSAVAVGAAALGASMGKSWDIWQSDFIMNNVPSLVQPAFYVIGVCGLISLITWFMCLGHCHSCEGKEHKR
jgi:hypothetical protein